MVFYHRCHFIFYQCGLVGSLSNWEWVLSEDKLNSSEKNKFLQTYREEIARIEQLSDNDLADEEKILMERLVDRNQAKSIGSGASMGIRNFYREYKFYLIFLLIVAMLGSGYLLFDFLNRDTGVRISGDLPIDGPSKIGLQDICEFRLRTAAGDASILQGGALVVGESNILFPMISCRNPGFVHFFILVEGMVKPYLNNRVKVKALPYPLVKKTGGFLDFFEENTKVSKISIYVTKKELSMDIDSLDSTSRSVISAAEIIWNQEFAIDGSTSN